VSLELTGVARKARDSTHLPVFSPKKRPGKRQYGLNPVGYGLPNHVCFFSSHVSRQLRMTITQSRRRLSFSGVKMTQLNHVEIINRPK
jgi:hypothetical protein